MGKVEVEETIIDVAGGGAIRPDRVEKVFRLTAAKQYKMSELEAQSLIKFATFWFREACLSAGHSDRQIRALTTKFRDAGRRSAPWKPASSKVPGRPQDGADGNRISRWLLPPAHKFYATEINATLVEVKYILQTMSMVNAPESKIFSPGNLFTPWLIEHQVKVGEYRDPVQLVRINFLEFLKEPRSVQSGHLIPLDQGGKHYPDNTFLMLFRSNQLQGNLKVAELLEVMETIVNKHKDLKKQGDKLEKLIHK